MSIFTKNIVAVLTARIANLLVGRVLITATRRVHRIRNALALREPKGVE